MTKTDNDYIFSIRCDFGDPIELHELTRHIKPGELYIWQVMENIHLARLSLHSPNYYPNTSQHEVDYIIRKSVTDLVDEYRQSSYITYDGKQRAVTKIDLSICTDLADPNNVLKGLVEARYIRVEDIRFIEHRNGKRYPSIFDSNFDRVALY